MDKNDPVWQNLQRFANEHKLVLEDDGEVGFMRECVGFVKGNGYVNYNPWRWKRTGELNPGMEKVEGFHDLRLGPPAETEDAYHKHECLAVLVHGDDADSALRQLNLWVEKLESYGEPLEVSEFETEASGVQLLVSGAISWAIRFKPETPSICDDFDHWFVDADAEWLPGTSDSIILSVPCRECPAKGMAHLSPGYVRKDVVWESKDEIEERMKDDWDD